MDNTIIPVASPYYVTPPTAYTSSAGNVSSYEELLSMEEYNLAFASSLNGSSSASGTSVDAGLNSADLLNLSPEALFLLNGFSSGSGSSSSRLSTNGVTAATGTSANPLVSPFANTNFNSISEVIAAYNGTNGTTTTDPNTASADATLDSQAQIAAIISQYASAPLTPATVSQINTALNNAGIDPQQLSLQEILYAYAAFVPTQQNTNDLIANYELSDELLDA